MGKLLISLIFCLVKLISVNAQNLLLNGDFEEFSNCQTEQGQFENCRNWSVPNKSTPDFFRNCNNIKNPFSVPYNGGGKQEPQNGKAYSGFYLLKYDDFKDREYIQGELSEPLEKDKTYFVSFYLSFGDRSNFPCDRLGYKFSKEQIIPAKNNKYGAILKEKSNSTLYFEKTLIQDKEFWHRVTFEYKAIGGEKFLTFGIFKNDIKKEEYKHLRDIEIEWLYSNAGYAYYYVDNISVTQKKTGGNNTLGSE